MDDQSREREEELMREMHGLKKRLSRPLGEDELHVIQQQLSLRIYMPLPIAQM